MCCSARATKLAAQPHEFTYPSRPKTSEPFNCETSRSKLQAAATELEQTLPAENRPTGLHPGHRPLLVKRLESHRGVPSSVRRHARGLCRGRSTPGRHVRGPAAASSTQEKRRLALRGALFVSLPPPPRWGGTPAALPRRGPH